MERQLPGMPNDARARPKPSWVGFLINQTPKEAHFFNPHRPDADIGMDLSKEYQTALKPGWLLHPKR
jgi:hypothetical protein